LTPTGLLMEGDNAQNPPRQVNEFNGDFTSSECLNHQLVNPH
jgi:hypothetical protein